MLEATDPSPKARLIDLGERRGGIFINYVSAQERNDAGQRGFEVLGAEASNAVPALLRIAGRNRSPASHSAAIAALGAIGPPARAAVPYLLEWATNDGKQAGAAIRALGRIRAEPSIVVSFLTNALADPDTRPSVVFALVWFATSRGVDW
jgi:HEAT repeat protein